MQGAPTHTHHEGHEALMGKVIGRLTGRPAKRASDVERGQAHTPKASQEWCVCPASLHVSRLRRPNKRPFVIFVAKPVVIFVVPKAA